MKAVLEGVGDRDVRMLGGDEADHRREYVVMNLLHADLLLLLEHVLLHRAEFP